MKRRARVRQRLGDQRVPEEQLHQQRHVADQLDITAAQRFQKDVFRQPEKTDCRADRRGEHDAEHRHLEGVGEADGERPGVAVGGAVGERGLADLEAGFAPQECETARDPARFQVGERVKNQHRRDAEHRSERERLIR